jgi:hypothetical protein
MNHSAEIKALKARIAALEAQAKPPASEPEPSIILGIRKIGGNGNSGSGAPANAFDRLMLGDGEKNLPDGAESYEQRMATRRAAEDRHAAAQKAERDALGGGYIDACGIRRGHDGRQASAVDQERQAVDEIVKQQFED